MTNPIHIGLLIRAELFKQQKSVKWLADKLGVQRANCYRILNAPSIHTAQLISVSVAMQHDFFVEISNQLSLAQAKQQRLHNISKFSSL